MSEIKEAKVVWKGDGLSFSSELGSGYRLDVGGPSGGSPMELLLAGVAGCTAMDVVNILQKMPALTGSVRLRTSADYPMVHRRQRDVHC